MFNDRTKLLFGDKLDRLDNKSVLIVGLGGVGGYVCEMLARVGINKLTIVDFDKVDQTNINRQIIALNSTVGKLKTQAMKERILDINPNCEVTDIDIKLDKANLEMIFGKKYDFVIDAIDIVTDKVDLISYCYNNNIKCISAMGAGNRCGVPNFQLMDIFETKNDGLAKILRKKLRENMVKKHLVVCSTEKAIKNIGQCIGSVAYQPAMCGIVIASYVIDFFIGDKNESN